MTDGADRRTLAERRAPSTKGRGIYQLAEYRIDAVHHRLFRAHELLSDDERTVEFLWLLIRDYPRTVGKDELLEALWPRVVVTEWSLSRLVSDTRQLLRDNGEEQALIRTVRGTGFKLLKEPQLEADTPPLHSVRNTDDAAHKATLPKQPLRKWVIGVAAMALIAFGVTWRMVSEQQAQVAARNAGAASLHDSMRRLQGYQEMSFTAFKAQVARRDDLVAAIETRFHVTRTEEFEKFFSKYFNQLNSDERFAFDQIRALTTGHLRDANQGMLDEIERNPDLLNAVPSLRKVRQHVVFWLKKYESTFVTRADMCILYSGVEDGVPYPAEADKDVIKWLKTHAVAK